VIEDHTDGQFNTYGRAIYHLLNVILPIEYIPTYWSQAWAGSRMRVTFNRPVFDLWSVCAPNDATYDLLSEDPAERSGLGVKRSIVRYIQVCRALIMTICWAALHLVGTSSHCAFNRLPELYDAEAPLSIRVKRMSLA